MIFNSLAYLAFLPCVAVVHFILPSRFQWLWLLLCSGFFYYTILPAYLILFSLLIVVNYYFGLAIQNSSDKKKARFIIALLTNLSILAFFKYFGFLQQLFNNGTNTIQGNTFWRIILPVGLSYFIFTILSYLIEVKRGKINAETHLGIFASGLMFFPKLLQGPIERPAILFSQFKEEKQFDYESTVEGLKLILYGFFKKLVIADRLGNYVNVVYDDPGFQSGPTLIFATILYAFQIYADFSGYTDIALGSARILGFKLTNNFNRPYFATSVKEFWNRWHISFSSWLRDYLFLPLAYFFSNKMKKPVYWGIATEKWIFLFSSIITFSICGIWHGEGINFLIWGLVFS